MMANCYRVEDLSQGREPLPIPAMNEWMNLDRIKNFEYISEPIVGDEIAGLFAENSGCSCGEGCDCGPQSSCPCAKVPEESGNSSAGACPLRQHCSAKSCSCGAGCSNLLTDCRALVPFEVYYVNPHLGFGVRTMRPIAAGTTLFEYAGVMERDRPEQMKEDDYIFYFRFAGVDLQLDANRAGNVSRFVNHSCEPNLRTELVLYGKKRMPHVVFVAIRDILPGDPLTISYGEEWWNAKHYLDCHCKSASCLYSNNVEFLSREETRERNSKNEENKQTETIEKSRV